MTQQTTENNTSINSAHPTCWIVTEGHIGTENQCIGVCNAMGITPEIKRIKLRQPWQLLSPSFRMFRSLSISSKGDSLKAPFPDLVIASGRKAVIAALHIRKASKGKTMIVFLQDPGISPHYFDLVCVPFHDKLRGSNVLVTEGAPNRILLDDIKKQSSPYDQTLTALPSPRIAVLLGGNSKRHTLSQKRAMDICNKLKHMQDDYGAGLMISISRRTPDNIRQYFKKEFANHDCFFWDGEGENPYFALFKYADTFIVTEDSISMLSDAATTGKPVYRMPLDGKSGKFENFFTYMEERDTIRPFDGSLDQWSYRPLQDSQMIAAVIQAELKNLNKDQ